MGTKTLEIRQSFLVEVFIMSVFAMSEISLAINPLVGTYALTITIIMFTAAALYYERLRKLFIALCIFLVAQHASIALAITDGYLKTTVLYTLVLLLSLAYRYLFTLGLHPRKSKLKVLTYVLLMILMILAGAGLGTAGYHFVGKTGFTLAKAPTALLLLSLPVWAFAEEMLFRGLIQYQALKTMRSEFALVISAGVYALAYAAGGLRISLVAVATSIVLTFIYYKKQNLMLTTALNMAAKLTFAVLALNIVR